MGKKDKSLPTDQVIYNKLSAELENREFKKADLTHYAALSMQEVENYNLSGPQKKEVVLRVAERIVENHAPEEERSAILDAVQSFLPGAIDQLAAAAKGQLKINLDRLFKDGCASCSCFGKKK